MWGEDGGTGVRLGVVKFSRRGSQRRTKWSASSVAFWLAMPPLSPTSFPFWKSGGVCVVWLSLGILDLGPVGGGTVTPSHDLP